MLFCTRLRTFAVPCCRPGFVLPVPPLAEAVGSTLLYASARLGKNGSQVGEEVGVGVGVEGGDVRTCGVWEGPAYIEIQKGST